MLFISFRLQIWFSFSFSKTGKERSPSSSADSEQELLFLLQKEDGISVPQLCGLRLHWESALGCFVDLAKVFREDTEREIAQWLVSRIRE